MQVNTRPDTQTTLSLYAEPDDQTDYDLTADSFRAPDGDRPRDILEHLLELRRRLLIIAGVFLAAFCLCYYKSDDLLNFFIYPLKKILAARDLERHIIYTHLIEGFLTHVKVSAFCAGLLAIPCLMVQVWRFIAPALFKQERRCIAGILVSTPLLFTAGVLFAYFVALPNAYDFFITFEQPESPLAMPIRLEARLHEYMSFVMQLVTAFGICFEMPVLFVLLSRLGIIKAEQLIRHWRIAVVGIFMVSAVITPPDIFSMIALGLPLVLLYFTSCILVRIFARPAAEVMNRDYDVSSEAAE